MTNFDSLKRRGVYAIPVLADGDNKGKIFVKTSDPENDDKVEYGNISFSNQAVFDELTIPTLILAQQKRHVNPGIWELISGGIKPNETSLGAMVREVKEEVGADISPDQLTSLEIISPESVNWVSSIVVQQIKKGFPITLDCVGFALSLYEADIESFLLKHPEANYALVDPSHILEFMYLHMLDKEVRPTSALYIIDLLADLQKRSILETFLSGLDSNEQLLAAAGD